MCKWWGWWARWVYTDIRMRRKASFHLRNNVCTVYVDSIWVWFYHCSLSLQIAFVSSADCHLSSCGRVHRYPETQPVPHTNSYRGRSLYLQPISMWSVGMVKFNSHKVEWKYDTDSILLITLVLHIKNRKIIPNLGLRLTVSQWSILPFRENSHSESDCHYFFTVAKFTPGIEWLIDWRIYCHTNTD